MSRDTFTGHSQKGFSLLELALVMFIVGILMGGLLLTVGSTAENRRRNETRELIAQVQEALYGYAQVHGRLPCPSTVATAGFEALPSGSVCTSWHGFIPSATLGITGNFNDDGLLLDAWHNPLRYSLAETSEPNGGFASVNDIQVLFNSPPLLASPPMLQVCSSADCSSLITLTSPAVVLSMGRNWRDIATATADEQANAFGATDTGYALTSTNTFVSSEYAEDAYDDLVSWISAEILFSRMITAGKLP